MNEYHVTLSSDEMRALDEFRAQKSISAGPNLPGLRLSTEEWALIQQRRLAQQSRLLGSGIATNHPDPFREQCSVAIVMLKDIRAEIGEAIHPPTKTVAQAIIDKKLAILGADAEESGSPSPGSG